MPTPATAAISAFLQINSGKNHEPILVIIVIFAENELVIFHLDLKTKFAQNISMDPKEAKNRIWHYHLDTEGQLWHEGSLFEDPTLLNFFMKKMDQLPDGRFQVICQGETCLIEPEDAPYVVLDIEKKGEKIELIFPGDYREILDPSSLYVGKDNVLYCKVRAGRFAARFNRKPYFELSHWINLDETRHEFFLNLGKKHFPIQGVRG